MYGHMSAPRGAVRTLKRVFLRVDRYGYIHTILESVLNRTFPGTMLFVTVWHRGESGPPVPREGPSGVASTVVYPFLSKSLVRPASHQGFFA